ncbi:unnamed protein product [Thelazia callipaeda]|uniref:Paraoxonase n=1 Tax=Thelazia callipaeda TaxID=103827 RepID=A0A0N5CZC8_THECL|nr:unnamed protein product [Thelazia callipaeda]
MSTSIITLLFVGLGCSIFVRLLLLLDVNKRVYNHTPGPCRLVWTPAVNGSGGITLISELDIALITSGYAKSRGVTSVVGAIYLYNFTDNRNYKANKLNIKGFDLRKFIPYGIDTYVSRGRVTVYVTNSLPNNDTVEVFQLDLNNLALIHRKTISSSKFLNLADIVVVGADRFVVTNYLYFRQRWMQMLELAMQAFSGSVVYYDGHEGSYLLKYFPAPNGIALNKQKNQLYVASTISEFIRVYNLRQDMSLLFETEISLLSSPNKLFVEEATGDIWIALHPVLYKAHEHIQDPANMNLKSPSQILRIRLQDDGKSWVITEPYANDGATIWGSSAVLFHKNIMLIGSFFGRTLHCDIDSSQIV